MLGFTPLGAGPLGDNGVTGTAYSLTATSSKVTLAPVSARLRADRRIVATATALSVRSTNTRFLTARRLFATTTALAVRGVPVLMGRRYSWLAVSSKVMLAGVPVTFGSGTRYSMAALASKVTLAGVNVTFKPGTRYSMAALVRKVTLAPKNAVLRARRFLRAGVSKVTLTGYGAQTYTSGSGFVGLRPKEFDWGCLVRIAPIDSTTGTRSILYASSFGNRSEADVNGLGGNVWEPCLASRPRVGQTLWNGDFSEAISTPGASLPINLAVLGETYADASRYYWAGALVEIYAGRPGDAWPWPTLFKGTIKSYGGTFPMLSLDAEVDLAPFEREVLTATYAGTGGIEGASDLKNRAKPLILGWAQNVEPLLLDAVNYVYQFSAYGPIEAVSVVYERGSDFGPSVGDFATLAALLAANVPEGKWATCLSLGLIRLGAPAAGVITGDVRGHKIGAATPRLTGAVIKALAQMTEVATDFIDAATLDAMDAAVPYPINVVITENAGFLAWARRLALACNWQAGVSPAGKFFVTTPDLTADESLTLDAQGRALPLVSASQEIDVSPPFSKTTMGAARSWRVHTPDEIAFYTTVTPKGRYSDTTIYREGDVVNLIDGSEWIFINATPSAGFAPPTWPSTENAYWANMTPPSDLVSAQVAIRTAAIRRPRDANNVAREMLIATTDPVSGVPSISVARHDWDYPTGSEDITRAPGPVNGPLQPDQDYYVYFDDATLANLDPSYVAAGAPVDGENSSDHPFRHALGKIRTPAKGQGPNYGGAVPGYGYQVLVDAAALLATNFNARNDQNGAPIIVPIVASDGTAIDHVLNPNASVDVSFQWAWFGNNADIDGFEVMLYSSTAATPYSPGSSPAAESIQIVPPNVRAFIARGITPTQNLTFAVRAFRVVDPNIDIDQVMHSAWVMSTAAGEKPYKPEAQIAFAGDITGTIEGIPAQDVSDTVLNFNARNDQDGSAIPLPTMATDGTAVDHTLNANASADISLEWLWSGTNESIDGWEIIVVGRTSSAVYNLGTTPSLEMLYSMPPDRRAFLVLGVHPGLYYSMFLRAFRMVDPNIDPSGKIVTEWVRPSVSSERTYCPSSTAPFTGNITGTINGVASSTVTAAAANFNARNDRLATPIDAVTFPTNGEAVDHVLKSNGSADLSLEWSWAGNVADIDGFDVMVYSSTSSSVYAPGSTPMAEQIYRTAPDKRAFVIYGVPPDSYYTLAVRPFRTVDPDVDPSGIINGPWAKPTLSDENPYRPTWNVSFEGDILGTVYGLAAATVSAGAQAAMAGLNADGTIRGSRVGTDAIQNQALVAAGWAEQGSGIGTAPNETYTNIVIFSQYCQGKRLVLNMNMNLEVMVTNPVQGQLYATKVYGILQGPTGTLVSTEAHQSFRWHGPSATGTYFSELRNLFFEWIWNNLPAGYYNAGYQTANQSTNGSYTWPYRYAKLNDLRATE